MESSPKKNCTIRELAHYVGLSTCTVSRVLNYQGTGALSIPEKTQKRILDAAKKLNYVPNVNAQRFFTRRSNVIGLLVPSQEEMGHSVFADTHFAGILSGIEHALTATEYNLLLLFNRPEYKENRRYEGMFKSGFLDGLLIWGIHRSDRYWEQLARLSGPRIFLTSIPETGSGTEPSFVASDYEQAAYGIVTELLRRGCRRFCWLAGNEDTSLITQLREGIRKAGVELPPDDIRFSDYTEEAGSRCIADLFAGKSYDAVLATAPQLARSAMRFVEAHALPVQVGSFDGQKSTRHPADHFISALTNDSEIGKTAFEKLVARIKGKEKSIHIRIPVDFCFSPDDSKVSGMQTGAADRKTIT